MALRTAFCQCRRAAGEFQLLQPCRQLIFRDNRLRQPRLRRVACALRTMIPAALNEGHYPSEARVNYVPCNKSHVVQQLKFEAVAEHRIWFNEL